METSAAMERARMAGSELSFHGIIGRSAAMRALFDEIKRFAPVDVPILIRGESGTGKELVAKAIQRLSGRRERPFEKLNCADLTKELLRNELFGHERGAFTGAVSRAAGLVTRLDGGTLFMDEIGELAPDAQGMLLRFLQEGEGRPVGATRSITVDVRVIAATHQDLEAGVERGTFREDFYYRLWWAVLEVPPLRARREDIALLVEHFRVSVNRDDGLGLDIKGVTREAMAVLEGDDWPGNVRELEAVVKRAMVRRRVGWVTREDIVLPRLRRERVPGAMRALGIELTPVQEEALRLASGRGAVRRGDLVARCGISRETARKALLDLERAGALRREGRGRGVLYVPVALSP
ncbi:MAG: sigma 54-interacting transcriptional regulator [bacterium]